MKSMSKPSDNLGGLNKIWAVPPSDIIVSRFSAEIISSENIIELYCTPETMQFTEDNETVHGSVSYDTEITAVIPKDCQENASLIDHLSGKKWIVIFQNENEQFKVSGTNDIPHRYGGKFDSGKAISDRSGHEISFHSTQLRKAITILNPF